MSHKPLLRHEAVHETSAVTLHEETALVERVASSLMRPKVEKYAATSKDPPARAPPAISYTNRWIIGPPALSETMISVESDPALSMSHPGLL